MSKEDILFGLAVENKVLYYDSLLKKLNVKTITEVDDIIISCIHKKLFEGHIDHQRNCLFISSVRVGEVGIENVPEMIKVLQSVSNQCAAGLKSLD